jgi:hypothetical protein
MERVVIHDAQKLELQRCFKCDCRTYPICTWFGEPCKECFQPASFRHKRSCGDRPGLFENGPSASDARTEDRPLIHTRVTEIRTSANGDCFYDCIAKALNRYLNKSVATAEIGTAELRYFASRQQTQATFEAYRTASLANEDEYKCVARARNLRAFRNAMQQTGDEVGVENCLWGDENALQIVSDAFHLRILVFDQRGQMIQVIGQEGFKHTLLLRLNRNKTGQEHFTLLAFNEQTVLVPNEWTWLKKHLKMK